MNMQNASPNGISRLLTIMQALRDPETGCPWDIEQSFSSIAPYTIEEAYEVAEAIRNADMGELCDELGDLLLQVVYHAQIAAESHYFDFDRVAHQVSDKMVRRHPHVFGTETVGSADAQIQNWEQHKAAERVRKAEKHGRAPSTLDGVALGLPALMRAVKLQKRAARDGFDWPETKQVLAKLDEEIGELRAELESSDPARLQDEIGDMLFTVANLARKLDIDPEVALRDTNAKFEARYRGIETNLAKANKHARDCTLDELEDQWQAVKKKQTTGT